MLPGAPPPSLPPPPLLSPHLPLWECIYSCTLPLPVHTSTKINAARSPPHLVKCTPKKTTFHSDWFWTGYLCWARDKNYPFASHQTTQTGISFFFFFIGSLLKGNFIIAQGPAAAAAPPIADNSLNKVSAAETSAEWKVSFVF